MKKVTLFLAACLLAGSIFGEGIRFEQGSWAQVVSKARQERKLIFVDIYTTWCGPCKMMDKKLFPHPEAGKKYNTHFINYKIDAEKGEGIDIADRYHVKAYPTNLFIDPETEEVVYTALGYCELTEFLHRADVAIAEGADTMSLKAYELQYARKNYEKDFLIRYIEKLKRLDKDSDEQMDAYLHNYVTQEPSQETLAFLKQNVSSMGSQTFDYLMGLQENSSSKISPGEPADEWMRDKVWATFDKAAKKMDTALLAKLESIMEQYSLYSDFLEKDQMRIRFYQLNAEDNERRKLQAALADKILATSFDEFQKEDEIAWKNYQTNLRSQLLRIGQSEQEVNEALVGAAKDPMLFRKVSDKAAAFLNTVAWEVYENDHAEKTSVLRAEKWSAYSLSLITETHPNWSMFADTYAHLLYKSGAEKEAIAQQKKAIEVAKLNNPDMVEDLVESLHALEQNATKQDQK